MPQWAHTSQIHLLRDILSFITILGFWGHVVWYTMRHHFYMVAHYISIDTSELPKSDKLTNNSCEDVNWRVVHISEWSNLAWTFDNWFWKGLNRYHLLFNFFQSLVIFHLFIFGLILNHVVTSLPRKIVLMKGYLLPNLYEWTFLDTMLPCRRGY